jgi:hypothetical protein
VKAIRGEVTFIFVDRETHRAGFVFGKYWLSFASVVIPASARSSPRMAAFVRNTLARLSFIIPLAVCDSRFIGDWLLRSLCFRRALMQHNHHSVGTIPKSSNQMPGVAFGVTLR